jgi:CheY-like chemotaxis protein
MQNTSRRVLVVDDEPSICEGVESVLTRAGYEVKKAFSGEEAIVMNQQEEFDLILMDLIMPGMDGADTCAEIRRLRPKAKVVAISGSPAGSRVEKFIRSGGIEVFLYKPFGKEELLAGVDKALQDE